MNNSVFRVLLLVLFGYLVFSDPIIGNGSDTILTTTTTMITPDARPSKPITTFAPSLRPSRTSATPSKFPTRISGPTTTTTRIAGPTTTTTRIAGPTTTTTRIAGPTTTTTRISTTTTTSFTTTTSSATTTSPATTTSSDTTTSNSSINSTRVPSTYTTPFSLRPSTYTTPFSLQPTVKPTKGANAKDSSSSKSISSGNVAYIIVGILAGCLCLAIAVIFYCYKKRQEKFGQSGINIVSIPSENNVSAAYPQPSNRVPDGEEGENFGITTTNNNNNTVYVSMSSSNSGTGRTQSKQKLLQSSNFGDNEEKAVVLNNNFVTPSGPIEPSLQPAFAVSKVPIVPNQKTQDDEAMKSMKGGPAPI